MRRTGRSGGPTVRLGLLKTVVSHLAPSAQQPGQALRLEVRPTFSFAPWRADEPLRRCSNGLPS